MEYMKTVFDCATGKQETIPMTDEEIATKKAQIAESEARQKAEAEAAAEKEAQVQSAKDKLAALGLTESEITALLGA